MQKTFLLVSFLFFLLNCKGQKTKHSKADGKIIGIVIDSTSKNPIEYATISLYLNADKIAVNGTITDSSGNFTLTGINTGVVELHSVHWCQYDLYLYYNFFK